MTEYIKGFLALFILMTMLLHLVPGESLKKYIRFFAEIVLIAGFLTPVLSLFFDSEEFMEKIDYETFTENISEMSLDMQRMEYMQADYYREEYENAIAEDVWQMADGIVAVYGYGVSDVSVQLTDDYKLEAMQLSLCPRDSDRIFIGEIVLGDGSMDQDQKTDENEGMTGELRKRLTEYYQTQEERITVTYT